MCTSTPPSAAYEFAWKTQDDESFRWIQQRTFQLVVAIDIP